MKLIKVNLVEQHTTSGWFYITIRIGKKKTTMRVSKKEYLNIKNG